MKKPRYENVRGKLPAETQKENSIQTEMQSHQALALYLKLVGKSRQDHEIQGGLQGC